MRQTLSIPLQINEMNKRFYLAIQTLNGTKMMNYELSQGYWSCGNVWCIEMRWNMWSMKCRCIMSDVCNSILYPNIPFFTLLSNPTQSHFTVGPAKRTREIYFAFNGFFDSDNQFGQQLTWQRLYPWNGIWLRWCLPTFTCPQTNLNPHIDKQP